MLAKKNGIKTLNAVEFHGKAVGMDCKQAFSLKGMWVCLSPSAHLLSFISVYAFPCTCQHMIDAIYIYIYIYIYTHTLEENSNLVKLSL